MYRLRASLMTGCALLRSSISALVHWQCFLNLLKLWFAETGNMPDEFNKPVFQQSLTLLVAAATF